MFRKNNAKLYLMVPFMGVHMTQRIQWQPVPETRWRVKLCCDKHNVTDRKGASDEEEDRLPTTETLIFTQDIIFSSWYLK